MSGEPLLFDSNILIYAYSTDPRRERAIDVMRY
jgi:predicted nucleic acid-binding protein